jgi:hypothetical protein
VVGVVREVVGVVQEVVGLVVQEVVVLVVQEVVVLVREVVGMVAEAVVERDVQDSQAVLVLMHQVNLRLILLKKVLPFSISLVKL